MIRNKILALATSVLLTLSLASNANQQDTVPAAAETSTAVKNTNMVDPNYWMDAFTAPDQPPISNEITFNAANPGAWMRWPNPATHMATHKSFMNPATYAGLMGAQTCDPKNPDKTPGWFGFGR